MRAHREDLARATPTRRGRPSPPWSTASGSAPAAAGSSACPRAARGRRTCARPSRSAVQIDVDVTPVRYARITNSTGSGSHSRATITFGSGTSMHVVRARGRAVASNQNAASWFSTWPLNGIVPSTDVERADAVGDDDDRARPSRRCSSRAPCPRSFVAAARRSRCSSSVCASWARRMRRRSMRRRSWRVLSRGRASMIAPAWRR